MSERITEARVRQIMAVLDYEWSPGLPRSEPQKRRDDTHAALAELLSLRAEVERLRDVEKAARELTEEVSWYHLCPLCNRRDGSPVPGQPTEDECYRAVCREVVRQERGGKP